MPRYLVECDVGTLTVTVDASSEDDAIVAADEQWSMRAFTDLTAGASWSVREVGDDVRL